MTAVWKSSRNSAAGAQVGARDPRFVFAALQAVCEPIHSLASVVQSRALGDEARRMSVRLLATASFLRPRHELERGELVQAVQVA
jgi:hypothetical protein